MSFSLSGDTITQTGTDTDLSGLDGVSGVTTLDTGSLVIYFLDDRRIEVEGDLSFDPEDEQLIFKSNCPFLTLDVLDGASLTIGSIITLNAHDRYSEMMALYFGRIQNSSGANNEDVYGSLRVNTGGTFEMYGGQINTGLPVGFKAGATVKLREVIIDMTRPSITSSNVQLRYFADIDFIGLKVLGAKTFFDDQAVINLEDYEAIHMIEPAIVGGTPVGDTFEIRDYNSYGNNFDATFLSSNHNQLKLINNARGTDVDISGYLGTITSNRDGSCELVSEFTVIVHDDAGVLIEGAKVFIEDVDNGGRQDRTEGISVDYTTSNPLIGTTDASGEYSDEKLVGVKVSNNDPTQPIDRRTASNDITDTDLIKVYQYGYEPVSIHHSHVGNGIKDSHAYLSVNAQTTESDIAIVQAYSESDTAEKLKDCADAYLYDHFDQYQSFIVSRDFGTVDAGDYDVTIDPTHDDLFSISGNTLLIKATTFTGTIVTTGTISLLNGAEFADPVNISNLKQQEILSRLQELTQPFIG